MRLPRLPERKTRYRPSEFRSGTRVVDAELPPGYTPPSASMNPNATVEQIDLPKPKK